MANYKNIVVSTHDSLYPINGGGALRTLRVAAELKNRGFSPILIAPADGLKELNGIKTLSLPQPTKRNSQILSVVRFNIRLIARFIRFAAKSEVFFIHNTIAAISLPVLKKIFGFGFILDLTDIHTEYLISCKRKLLERILSPILLRYEYFIVKSADYITVATRAMKRLLISQGVPDIKIEVVYDGADAEGIPQEKEPGAEYGVIHLGAIDRQHGAEVIIRSMPYVAKNFPEAKFFFVGGGRELNNIKKLAEGLGVINNCIFTGRLPCHQARKFLKKASIGIIARRDSLPNRVITTLKIYEYWKSRTAIVSSRLEGIREIASENNDILWFEPGDEKDLGEKICFILKHKDLRERLIKGGLVTVNNFDIKESARRIADLVLNCRFA